MTKAVALTAAVILCAVAGSAVAQGQKVTVTNCPYPGVNTSCMMINDKNGTVYNITSAKPKPKLNDRAITVTGTVSADPSICLQGISLKDIKWKATKQRCKP